MHTRSLRETAHRLCIALLCVIPVPAFAGSMTLLGAGGPAAAGASFSLTATDNAVDVTGLTTITFSAKAFAIGTADSTRVIGVIVGERNSANTQLISSITFQGAISGTKVTGGSSVCTAAAVCSEIWWAAIPTGTTSTISITFVAANQRASIQVYSIIKPSSNAPTTSAVSSANAGTATITIPAGGAAIGGSFNLTGGPGTPTATPTGFNNLDLNNNITGAQQVYAFHSSAGVITGSQALTMTLSGSTGSTASSFAAWGP